MDLVYGGSIECEGWRQHSSLIFLILLFTKPNIELSGWLYQTKTHFTHIVYHPFSRVSPRSFTLYDGRRQNKDDRSYWNLSPPGFNISMNWFRHCVRVSRQQKLWQPNHKKWWFAGYRGHVGWCTGLVIHLSWNNIINWFGLMVTHVCFCRLTKHFYNLKYVSSTFKTMLV